MAAFYRLEELKREVENYLMNELFVRSKIESKEENQIRRALLEGLSREGLLSVSRGTDSSSSPQSTNSVNGVRQIFSFKGLQNCGKWIYLTRCLSMFVGVATYS